MVITEPNDFVRELHDRMKVMLEPDQLKFAAFRPGGGRVLRPAGANGMF